MTVYIDRKNTHSIASAVINDTEEEMNGIMSGISGVGVSSLGFSEDDKEYLKGISAGHGINFMLDASIQKTPDFYAVPYVDVFAFDSCGGWYAAVMEDVEYDSEVIYIDAGKNVYKTGMSFGKLIKRSADISASYAQFISEVKFKDKKDDVFIFKDIEEARKYFYIV